jgi:hypothetical protein
MHFTPNDAFLLGLFPYIAWGLVISLIANFALALKLWRARRLGDLGS